MKKMTRMQRALALIFLGLTLGSPAFGGEYQLKIANQIVNITGHPVSKITINGTIPGPTLYFFEGEDVTIAVTNELDQPTSVHWHGLIVPGAMDGVPGLNGFGGIAPGETFIYRFEIKQSGTYWYHAHSMGQEQEGHYGSIVITPKKRDPIRVERDYVVLLSDFTDETAKQILSNLKTDSGYYNRAKRTLPDFVAQAKTIGFKSAWQDLLEWGQMRMSPTDLSDVSNYTFLVNGQTAEQNWTGIFKLGESIRLRIINASSMSIYDLRIPQLKLKVVAADGQNVSPVLVDELRISPAETYDLILKPSEDKAYSIVAEPIDRSGFALATLAPRFGIRPDQPPQRKRTLLSMDDMGIGHTMAGMDHSSMPMPDMDMSSDQNSSPNPHAGGWADADTPPGAIALRYSDLRSLERHANFGNPTQDITVRLNGNMERYIWTINGKKHEQAKPIMISYGDRVRLRFVNESMMAHPMHLHGMFVQLENGQPVNWLPNKHTVIVPPGKTVSVLLSASEPGEWAFHCHLLYHMLSGMMTTVVVSTQAQTSSEDTTQTARHQHEH